MVAGREATIVLDESLLLKSPPLITLEALTGKAVALLACRAEAISATVFCKPKSASFWVSTRDGQKHIRSLVELKPCAPVVDFEIVNRAASDLVATG